MLFTVPGTLRSREENKARLARLNVLNRAYIAHIQEFICARDAGDTFHMSEAEIAANKVAVAIDNELSK